MNILKRISLLTLAIILLLGMFPAASAAEYSEEEQSCIVQMLNYYAYHRWTAETDIARLIEELAQSDPAAAQTWQSIMDYWAWADRDMAVTPDILPDDLPQDESLCIVVLGYALNPYGTMQDELIGRLEVALASSIKYPNAYILCTGGGTASKARKKTEAGQMAQWLKDHGVAESRIIVEDESLSTVENAQFSCEILTEEYPQVRHVAIVTSDYHVPRGCVYFHTQFALSALETGAEPLDIVGNAGYQIAYSTEEDMSVLYSGIAQLAGIQFKGRGKPSLSKLTHLEIDGEFTYEAGTAMTLTATAFYDTGFSRDVTTEAVFSGVDMSQPGEQLLTVTYTESGTEVFSRVLVDVTAGILAELPTEAPETLPAEAPAAEIPPATQPQAEQTATGTPAPLWPFVALASLLALLALLLRLKIHVNK
ncbi:MAG: YdcF family protein [Oscillospiraceae bacterium]|nr:YdcF family protein [Oscillospiraceae bacterium]